MPLLSGRGWNEEEAGWVIKGSRPETLLVNVYPGVRKRFCVPCRLLPPAPLLTPTLLYKKSWQGARLFQSRTASAFKRPSFRSHFFFLFLLAFDANCLDGLNCVAPDVDPAAL